MRRPYLPLALAWLLASGCQEPATSGPAPAAGADAPAAPEPGDEAGHAVLVDFAYGQESLAPLGHLERRIDAAVRKAGVGQYDGFELAADHRNATLFLYGPDADRLLAAIRPILEADALTQGASVRLRYGAVEEGARETKVTIGRPK